MRPFRIPLLLIALLSSLATSSIVDAFDGIEALAIVHNGGSETVRVEVEIPSIYLDCELLRDHPELLGDIPWGSPIEVAILPGENFGPNPINPGDAVGCTAARVTLGRGEPVVMFNHMLDFPLRAFPRAYTSLSEVDPAVLVIVEDSPQVMRPTSADFVFDAPESLGACEPAELLSWSTRASGELTVLSTRVDRGCTTLDLLTEADSIEPLELCIAPELVPWEEGDSLTLSVSPSALTLLGKSASLQVLSGSESLPFGLWLLPDRLTRFECVEAESIPPTASASEVHLVGPEIDHGVARIGEILSVQIGEDTDADIWFNRYDKPIQESTTGSIQVAILSWER